MNTQQIKIADLEKSSLNARKTVSKDGLDELKASIRTHGLMQNLVVIDVGNGRYEVIAGSRRLAALQALQAEGKLPAQHEVPCQVVTAERALELSIAENKVRHAMHPADEFEAFAELIAQGQSAEQVAQRFGVTEKHVLQRLKLGRVAPELLEAYRAEEVTLDALMAFAITDDHKRQVSVWKSLQGWQQNNERHIRECLTAKAVEADDGIAVFVGLDAYKAAGGTVNADLFSENVYLEDAALLEKLATEKLEAEAEKLRAEGWGWVEVEGEDTIAPYRCRRIEAKPVDAPVDLVAEKERLARESA